MMFRRPIISKASAASGVLQPRRFVGTTTSSRFGNNGQRVAAGGAAVVVATTAVAGLYYTTQHYPRPYIAGRLQQKVVSAEPKPSVETQDDHRPSEQSDKDTPSSSRTDTAGTDLYVRTSDDNSFAIFTGNANEYLAREVAMILNMQLGRASVGRFSDGEVNIKVLDNVRWKDTYVIQSLSPPVNESLMELLLLVTTLRRASVRHITAIIPYFGYTRHNRVSAHTGPDQVEEKGKHPVAAADVAKMLTVAGVDRVVFVDVHHAQVTGFFGGTPVDDLEVAGVAAKYFRLKNLRSPVVVAPDHDGVQRAKRFRDTLLANGHPDASLAVVVDHRRKGAASEQDFDKDFELVGEVKGRDCIIRDDIIESGKRVVNAAEKLKRAGAARVFAFTTHPLLTDQAFDAIEECSPLVEVVCCNTVPLKRMSDKVRQLSVGMLLAETVKRINKNESVSAMFAEKKQQQ